MSSLEAALSLHSRLEDIRSGAAKGKFADFLSQLRERGEKKERGREKGERRVASEEKPFLKEEGRILERKRGDGKWPCEQVHRRASTAKLKRKW